ncbi:MAG TPA: lyase family protein, partial [Candidatus Tectomicrobia bacterium]|nr:lyase family protein [Candidatus Tectomicrobia bacterium]
MPSHLIDYALFGDQFSTAEMRAIFDERAMLQRWLDVEAALAAAQAEVGVIPREAADAIARAARVDALDLEAVRAGIRTTAHPIVPVVRELERASGEAGRWVHWGATTQDIIDTGMVLQAKAALEALRRDLLALVGVLADLAERHRDTVMAGRTHGQQALPMTFGFKVATWVAELGRHVERVDQLRPRVCVGELAGAV